MDVLQTKPVSPVLTRERMERQFANDLMRMLLHLQYTAVEAEQFRGTPLLKEDTDASDLIRFTRELGNHLKETIRKAKWLIGVVKKIWPANADLLDQELDPDDHKIANVAQLTEWIATSKRDLTDEIDLVVNPTRRRDLLAEVWTAAMDAAYERSNTPAGSLHADHTYFDHWYKKRYPSK